MAEDNSFWVDVEDLDTEFTWATAFRYFVRGTTPLVSYRGEQYSVTATQEQDRFRVRLSPTIIIDGYPERMDEGFFRRLIRGPSVKSWRPDVRV